VPLAETAVILLTRCGECDERWCNTCETECPVCLIGAGTDTGVLTCSHCEDGFCRECVWSWECPDCQAVICSYCSHDGHSCGCLHGQEFDDKFQDEDDSPTEISETTLPPGFSIWTGTPRVFVDPKAWRPLWERRQKPKPWRDK
jgi:hypothetical protein